MSLGDALCSPALCVLRAGAGCFAKQIIQTVPAAEELLGAGSAWLWWCCSPALHPEAENGPSPGQ